MAYLIERKAQSLYVTASSVSENGKKWMQEKGGDFIALRAGFGFKSILKALVDTYVVANDDPVQD